MGGGVTSHTQQDGKLTEGKVQKELVTPRSQLHSPSRGGHSGSSMGSSPPKRGPEGPQVPVSSDSS